MKVLQIIPYFSWSYGGPVKVVYDLSNNLSKMGHDVTIYTTDVGTNHCLLDKDKIKLDNNVNIRYFKCINNWIANNMKFHLSIQMLLTIRKELKDFDVIHLHECRGIPNVYAWYYARNYHIPYILEAHGSVPKIISRQNNRLTLSKMLFDNVFGKKIVKNASRLIALNEKEANLYKSIGVNESKIRIIPNGIDLSRYNVLQKRGELVKKYSLEDKRLVIYVGRLHESKGIDLLIRAFSNLCKELDNVILLLIGPDDGYKVSLEELIASLKLNDKILFTGFITVDEKIQAFMEADVFVTPLYSGFPITFLEACMCGTPIITTDKGDKLDWIDNKVGYVVKYDENELKNSIMKILNNVNLKEKFGEEGRKLIKTEFDLNIVIRKIERVYRSVLANYPK